MSDVDLPALATKPVLTPIKEIDAALKACTFGIFQIRLLAITFVGYMSASLISSTTGYLLPVAECDLNMTLLQKGLLNAMPYTGMLLSAIIAGFLTDAFGRKIFIVVGFTGQFVFTVVEASSQTYELLVAAKFFEGLLFAACFSPVIALTTEFCSNHIRDRVILLQSSFVAISQILVTLLSWWMLMNDWKVSFFGGKYVLNTWNFYLYATSLWPLAACVMYGVFVPESPKYLVTHGKYDEARNILIDVYVKNTGKPADTYPFKNIWKDKTKHALDETLEYQGEHTFKHHIVAALHNVKPMFEKPLVVYLAAICLANYIIMSMYNVFRLWFPQLSAIVENYKSQDVQDLCVMLDAYTSDLKAIRNTTDLDVCMPTRSGNETYINSIIVGFACLVPYLITGVLVNRVGKKRLLMAAGVLSVTGTMCLRWANSIVAIVSLFSVTIAVSQIMLSLNQALTVEVFGTTTRTFAVSLMMFWGRIGTLSGNVAFPILLNIGCEVPFYTISGLMVCVTFLALFLPSKK
ncbi:unnamed protein product [Arctia plantaginis]|uniref:Major facilitator superfamily (MFS) profile domain-containing protein n=1 Tax=Arctia plantaginis TaxID=874455 RepID=A0A8S1AZI0_ARCPL|nr:unnamed protein product [Arctia plantaginis]